MVMLAIALMLLLSPGIIALRDEDAALRPMVVEGAEVSRFVVDPATSVAHYVVAEGRMFVADGGRWVETGALPAAGTLIADSDDPAVLWAGDEPDCYRGGGESVPLQRSDNGGVTWTDTGTLDLAPLASWSERGLVLASGCPGLHVSIDNGATFSTIDALPLGMLVTSFAVEQAPDGGVGPVVLLGLTGEGGTSYLYRLDLSDPAAPIVTDTGHIWYAISPIAVSDDGVIAIAAAHGVVTSQDGGETWEVVRDGLESTTVEVDLLVEFPPELEPNSFGLGAIFAYGDDWLIGGLDGVYRLDADAETWELAAPTEVPVEALAVDQDSGLLLVQTEGGVFTLDGVIEATPAS